MNTINQVCAFMENRPGMLVELLKLLSDEGIDLKALNVAENEDYGVLRIIPDDSEKTIEILKDNGYVANSIKVCAIEVPDKPGGLTSVLELLANDGVDIQYMYSVVGFTEGKAFLVINAKDVDILSKSIEKNKINSIIF